MITISVNNNVIMTITDDILKVMEYSISQKEIPNVISKEISRVIGNLILSSKKSLQDGWIEPIRQKYDSMPTKEPDIATLIYSQPDYQDYDQRDKKNAKILSSL